MLRPPVRVSWSILGADWTQKFPYTPNSPRGMASSGVTSGVTFKPVGFEARCGLARARMRRLGRWSNGDRTAHGKRTVPLLGRCYHRTWARHHHRLRLTFRGLHQWERRPHIHIDSIRLGYDPRPRNRRYQATGETR